MWWIPTALAVPPDKQVANLSVGEAQLERFVVSPDGRFVTGRDARDGSENAWVLDIETWQVATSEICQVGGVGVRPVEGTDAADLWIACSDGTLRQQRWEDGVISDVADEDGVGISIDVAGGLAAAWYSAFTDQVYALSFAGDAGEIYVFDPESLTLSSAGPIPLSVVAGYETLAEGVISLDGTRLILAHGAGRVTNLDLGTEFFQTDIGFFALTDPIDVTPSLNGGIYAVDGEGRLAEYFSLSNQWTYLVGVEVAELDPQAIVYNPVIGDEWMVIFGERVRVWTLTNGAFDDTEPEWESPDLLNIVHDGIAHDNYVFGGGEGGGLRVITARPWIEPGTMTVSPETAITGTEVTVTFTVDEDVDWDLRLGGDRTGTGAVLASGTAVAGEPQNVVTTVDGSWVEGDNRLYVIAFDGQLEGHGAVTVNVDNPPSSPTLTDASIGFAGSLLRVSFAGVPDADLDHYTFYLSDAPFTAAEYPTGGPELEVEGTKYPITVSAEPGAYVNQDLYPLIDGTEYWIGVRAVDAGGQESVMSEVVSGIPREGSNAAELAGETGGGPCATGPAGAAPLALVLAGLVRRRRRAALAAVAALAPLTASAADEREHWWNARDLSTARGNFEIRYGAVSFTDPAITEVYDQGAENVLAIEAGPQLARFFEVDLGVAFIQELSTTEAGGADSVEKTMLTAWPLTLDGTVRLHVLDEQIVVPHLRLGLDYLVWNEIDDAVDFTGKEKIHGTKLGAHWGVGGGILLDVFAPDRASLLEAQSGINDTWLVAEWRRQSIDDRKVFWEQGTGNGLDFTGTSFTIGVKLDY